VRVVVVHNRYRSALPSGENRVVEADIAALESEGVEVFPYIRDSDEIEGYTALGKAGVAVRPLASPVDSIAFRRLLRTVQPHIVHLHNPYPLISPWIVRTAKAMRVPVVQTVHNYRHVCANGLYFRDGHECHDCAGKAFPWPAIKHGCYRDSALQSIPMAASLWAHRSTWMMVDRFLPVGEHVADHLRAFGIPDHKIIVRPNVVADPGEPKPLGQGALFVGRLSEEKGIRLLLDAWKLSGVGAEHTLTIAGDGELRPLVEGATRQDARIRFVGLVPAEKVGGLYADAAIVAVPSLSPETDGLAVVNAMAAGRAVVSTGLGAPALYLDDSCGWIVAADPSRWAVAIETGLSDRSLAVARGQGSRRRFLQTRAGKVDDIKAVYGSLCAVPRGSMTIVGPDGVGKSTLVQELTDRAINAAIDVRTAHFRPHVVAQTRTASEGGSVTAPHEQTPRGMTASLGRSAIVWVDFVVGLVGPWRRAARRGLLLLERPWLDQVVDPRRYRLPPAISPVLRVFARLLPRSDVVVCLGGDASEIHRRKPEIGESEVARQQAAWREMSKIAGRTVVELDSVRADVQQNSNQLLLALAPPAEASGQSWIHPFGYPKRVDMRVTAHPVPRDALGIYPPQKTIAVARERLGRMALHCGLFQGSNAPSPDIEPILNAIGAQRCAVAAIRSSGNSRWILGIEAAGRLATVVKCGALDDHRLRNEASVLSDLQDVRFPFRAPKLVRTAEVGNAFILQEVGIRGRGSLVSLERVSTIAASLSNGDAAGFSIVHGDLAPWNLITDETNVWLLDWESATRTRRPLWDLAHFVIQSAALLGGDVTETARTLTGRGQIGPRHLASVGEDPNDAAQFVLRYLSDSGPSVSQAAEKFRRQLARELS